MIGRGRFVGFAATAAVAVPLLAAAGSGLPGFGDYRGPYGDLADIAGVTLRHATNAVTALVFDLRAFDTLGEEFILFAAVSAVTLLLRDAETGPDVPDHPRRRGDAVRLFGRIFVPLLALFGITLALHGQVTPGGGFQGGATIGTALLLIWLTDGHAAFARIAREQPLEIMEVVGVGGYALVGLSSLAAGAPFLANLLPAGTPGDILSAGQVPVISVLVGLAVTGGFGVMFRKFLDALRRGIHGGEP